MLLLKNFFKSIWSDLQGISRNIFICLLPSLTGRSLVVCYKIFPIFPLPLLVLCLLPLPQLRRGSFYYRMFSEAWADDFSVSASVCVAEWPDWSRPVPILGQTGETGGLYCQRDLSLSCQPAQVGAAHTLLEAHLFQWILVRMHQWFAPIGTINLLSSPHLSDWAWKIFLLTSCEVESVFRGVSSESTLDKKWYKYRAK